MAVATVHAKSYETTIMCVTGATGFLASCLVKHLLHKGYTVHATVRDPENEIKVRPLLDLPGAEERLKLFRADLCEDGSFDAAIDRCDGVFHVASPVDLAPKDPQNDVIKPAINGTLNVVRACTEAQTVKRVVVTSSVATTRMYESDGQNRCIDESCWRDVDFLQTKKPSSWAYGVSKTLAEQTALQYGKDALGLDVVTINPSLVMGSTIMPNVPITANLALSLLTGNKQSIETLKGIQTRIGVVPLVHVDDVSSAQIFLMENPSTYGRYICNAINISVPQLADYLSKRYPQYNVSTYGRYICNAINISVPQLADYLSKRYPQSGLEFDGQIPVNKFPGRFV